MALHDIGVVGMAVMGSNLALNMADHGYDVSVYNYTPDLTEQFLQERPHEKITGYFELKDFLASLKRPRKIMLMIMAGAPVDSMLDQLLPLRPLQGRRHPLLRHGDFRWGNGGPPRPGHHAWRQ